MSSKNEQGLRLAAKEGRESEVSELLSSGVDVNATDENRATALMEAARNGNVRICKILLQAGADVNLAILNGATPLISAVGQHHRALLDLLLSYGADPNRRVNGHPLETTLSFAVRDNNCEFIKALLNHGADVNHASEYSGWTPLIVSVTGGHGNAVDLLIASGADVNAQCHDGETALSYAMTKDKGIVRRLLDAGADPSIKNRVGTSPLDDGLTELMGDISSNDKMSTEPVKKKGFFASFFSS